MNFKNAALAAFFVCACPFLVGAEQTPATWEIKGVVTFDDDKNLTLTPENLVWQLIVLKDALNPDRDLSRYGSPAWGPGNTFTISANPKRIHGYATGPAIVWAYWNGRLGKTNALPLILLDARIANAELRFGPRCKAAAKVRLINFENEKPEPGVRLRLYYPTAELSSWVKGLLVAEATTDLNGIAEFKGVPAGRLILSRAASRDQCIGSLDSFPGRVEEPMVTASETERSMANFGFLPEGKGLRWGKASEIFADLGELKEGVRLVFSPLAPGDDKKYWPQALAFTVSVQAGGTVRTPIVPTGMYEVREETSNTHRGRVFIHGMWP